MARAKSELDGDAFSVLNRLYPSLADEKTLAAKIHQSGHLMNVDHRTQSGSIRQVFDARWLGLLSIRCAFIIPVGHGHGGTHSGLEGIKFLRPSVTEKASSIYSISTKQILDTS